MFVTGEVIMEAQNLNQNLEPLKHFKPFITEQAEIILICAALDGHEKEKTIESKPVIESEIPLIILAIHNDYKYELNYPALNDDDKIYFGHAYRMRSITKKYNSNDADDDA